MNINEYIQQRGISHVANLAKVKPSTVSHWKIYRACPRPEHMQKLVKDSGGFLTYEAIITGYLKHNKKTRG